jgi:hypothetical protein
MKKSYIIYFLMVIGIVYAAVFIAQADIMAIIDIPSLALIVVPAVLMLLSHFSPLDFVRAFKVALARQGADERELKNALLFFSTAQKLMVASAIAAIFIGIILILDGIAKGKADSAKILSNWLSVDLIAVLYLMLGMMLVTIPFKSAVRKRLNDLGR